MSKNLFYLLCLCIPFAGFGQLLEEGFEGTEFPPSGWTIDQTNADETWYQIAGVSGWNTGKAAAVEYDPALNQQDEWLITPAIDLSSVSDAVLSLAIGYSYYWGVDPNDNYDVFVKVSVDDGATWTMIWDGDEMPPFSPPFQLIPLSLPLTDFVGESSVKIAFQYYGSDGAGLYLDNILVETDTGGEPEYCIPGNPSFNDPTGITYVQLEDLENTTTGAGNYQDYTAMVANVEAGETYPLAVRVDTQGDYYVNAKAWIDWNRDGVFDTATEEYDLGQAYDVTDGAPDLSPADIAVPADASGEYRLRVRGSFGEATVVHPCDPQNWSETEDYTINVAGSEPGGPCDDKIIMECGETYTTTLVPGAGEWVNYTDVTWNYTGSEQVYEFTAPVTGTYEFEVDEGEEDADFFLMDACSNTAVNLSDGYWAGNANVTVDLVGGTTYYLIADLYSGSSSPSTVTIKINCPEDPDPQGCLEADPDLPQWPTDTFIPACDGTPETIAENCWTGEYSIVQVTAGTEYIFSSSVGTDLITISDENGTTVYAAGTASLTWTAPADELIRFYLHLDEDCNWGDDVNRSRIIQCGEFEEPTEYCEPSLDCTDGDLITNVTFQEINNDSDCGPNGYNDYTSMTAHVEAGGTYPMSVTVGAGWTYESVMVWIDFNHNFTFEPTEYYFIGSDPGTTNTADITIPDGTPEGEYRMRVRVGAVNPDMNDLTILACDEETVYGETEDYTLVVGEGSTNDCEQSFAGEPDTGVGFINNGTDVYVAANDINVEAGSQFTVETITLDVVTLGGEPTTFDVSFYTDNAGVDEQIESTQTGITPASITPNGTFGSTGFPVYTVELELPSAQLLQAGETESAKYWIGISGAPSAEATNVYWVSYLYADNPDSLPSWQSPDGGLTWAEFANSNGDAVEAIMSVAGICETLGVNDLTSFSFTYYPNPVKDVLNISTKKFVEDVSIYNLAGQMVMKSSGLSNGQINLSGLAPGIYIFRVVLEGGQVETFKIIKK